MQTRANGKVFYYADKISSVTSLAAGFNDANPNVKNLLSGVSLLTGIISVSGNLGSSSQRLAIKTDNFVKSKDVLRADFNKLINDINKLTPDELKQIENVKGDLATFVERFRIDLGLPESVSQSAVRKLGSLAKGGSYGKYSTKLDDVVEVLEKENLFGNQATTFLDAEYRTVKNTQEITAYRTFGGDATAGGSFVTTTKGSSRNELALLDEWNNTMQFEATLEVPIGTKMNIGKVGPQTGKKVVQTLDGGADQVILPYQWDTKWIKEIKDLKTGKVYKSLDEFAVDYPTLAK